MKRKTTITKKHHTKHRAKPRHMVKGSPEAKAHMARLRAMRKKH